MADSQTTVEPAVAEIPSDHSDACYRCGSEIAMGTENKQPGLEEENSSVAVDVAAGETLDEHCEDRMTGTSEASWEPPLTHTVPEHRPVDATLDRASVGRCSSHADKTSEGSVSLRANPSPCPPSAESSDNERQERVKRRSSASSLQQHTGCEAVERDQKDQQHILPSSPEIQDGGAAAGMELAPWQAEFDLEDVFKPVASRGQRSVRRSLRNGGSSAGSSAGLAWLPRTSPDSISGLRRRRRSRRLAAGPRSFSEEM